MILSDAHRWLLFRVRQQDSRGTGNTGTGLSEGVTRRSHVPRAEAYGASRPATRRLGALTPTAMSPPGARPDGSGWTVAAARGEGYAAVRSIFLPRMGNDHRRTSRRRASCVAS